jgi:hypothetical protein
MSPTKDRILGLPHALSRAQSLHWRVSQIISDRLATAEPDERPLEVIAQLAVLERALSDLHDSETRAGRRHDRATVAFLLALLGRDTP